VAPIVITDAASDLSLSIFIGIQAEAGTLLFRISGKEYCGSLNIIFQSFIFMKNLVHKIVSY
jgi:hypothetical protein